MNLIISNKTTLSQDLKKKKKKFFWVIFFNEYYEWFYIFFLEKISINSHTNSLLVICN